MADLSEIVTISSDGKVSIAIELQPASTTRGIVAVNEWRKRLQVRVTSPALKGEANSELISLMAELFNIKSSSVELDSGAKDRRKRILLTDITMQEVNEIITKLLEG
ncbi:MAG: YggU family protein [Euryarchaeota archaeon]|jgi:hypothetical protein|nr:YggU family protein [Euryarchaeota archaeon]